MPDAKWRDLGPLQDFTARPLQQVLVDGTPLAVSCVGGGVGVVSGVCNHVGGPLGEGHLDGEYIVCPWHQWKFHRRTGVGEPGFEGDRVPSHEARVENGRLLVNLTPLSTRHKDPHPTHPLARPVVREPGPLRVPRSARIGAQSITRAISSNTVGVARASPSARLSWPTTRSTITQPPAPLTTESSIRFCAKPSQGERSAA